MSSSTTAIFLGYIPTVFTLYMFARLGIFGYDRARISSSCTYMSTSTGLFYNRVYFRDAAGVEQCSAWSVRPITIQHC
jgi:hypothetical protein